MLDLNHPQTPFIFAMAREDDAVLSLAKKMTLVSTAEKAELFQKCQKHFSEMRKICSEGFKKSKKKSKTIDQLASEVKVLATTESTNDFLESWRGACCSVCGSEITDLEGYPDMIYCRTCLRVIDRGRAAVDQAFDLFCI